MTFLSFTRHPGGIIRRRFMEPMGLTMTDLASALDVSVSSVSRVVNEKAEISSDMALRLSHVLGGEAESWMMMQVRHSLAEASRVFDSSDLRRLTLQADEAVAGVE
ncbi:HigA family addiction module antitoxin [Halomonas salifodinae]|uniref:HigA family addiction module antitoxin n=1 Tax=Halomonas salifodinae TaxID=438745 RepID=A0ABW2F0A5_9GAMM